MCMCACDVHVCACDVHVCACDAHVCACGMYAYGVVLVCSTIDVNTAHLTHTYTHAHTPTRERYSQIRIRCLN